MLTILNPIQSCMPKYEIFHTRLSFFKVNFGLALQERSTWHSPIIFFLGFPEYRYLLYMHVEISSLQRGLLRDKQYKLRFYVFFKR